MYAAVPSSTIDWTLADGSSIPIEERGPEEILGGGADPIAPAGTRVLNPAFDVTPARLITGIITERGICPATASDLDSMFPEHRA
jgi:methylthioribose-1-phosphate isomerase